MDYKALASTILEKVGGKRNVSSATVLKDEKKAQTDALKRTPGTLFAPIQGRTIPLEDVEDEVFSSGALGTGVATIPAVGEVYAPCDGVITTFFPTGHAIGITATDGAEVLIHVGMDTVELQGEGFRPMAKEGDKVTKGQMLLKFDINLITSKGYKVVTPMIITNGDDVGTPVPTRYCDVAVGDVVLTYKK